MQAPDIHPGVLYDVLYVPVSACRTACTFGTYIRLDVKLARVSFSNAYCYRIQNLSYSALFQGTAGKHDSLNLRRHDWVWWLQRTAFLVQKAGLAPAHSPHDEHLLIVSCNASYAISA